MRIPLRIKALILPLLVVSAPALSADLADQSGAPLGAPTIAPLESTVAPLNSSSNYTTAPQSAGNGNAELLFQLQQLRSEVQGLRDQVEQQAQLLNRLQKDSRNRYLDVDRRLAAVNSDMAELKKGGVTTKSSTETVDVAPVPAVSGSAKDAYQQAYALVRGKKFDQAIKAYQGFIKNYPESSLLPNAYYWLGELYMVKSLTQEAERVFNTVVDKYPQSRKVADASYKLGQIYSRYGQEDKAKAQMKLVKEKYPKSTAAKLADRFLEKQAK